MTRGDLAGCGARDFSIEGDPATTMLTSLAALVEEVIVLLLVNLSVIVPILGRKTLLQGLHDLL